MGGIKTLSIDIETFPSVGDIVILPTEDQLKSIIESGENRWVYIGNRLLLLYEDIGFGAFSEEKTNICAYAVSDIKLMVELAAIKMFSKREIDCMFKGTYEKLISAYDGILTIGADVAEIPDGAYAGSSYIKKLVIEERAEPLIIGAYAFAGTSCSSIEGLEYCTSMGPGAFSHSQLSGTLKISNLTRVPECAFEYNNLIGLDLSDFCGDIGMSAFYGNNISSVRLGDIHSGKAIVRIDETAFCDNCLDSETINEIQDNVMVQYYFSAFDDQKDK